MKDLSSSSVNWPLPTTGAAGAGRGTHSSVWQALADSGNEPVEEASDEGSESSS